MATLTSVTKFFAVAKEGFTTTTASSIGSGAATVPLNSVTGYTNGDTVVLVIDPGDSDKKQAFTGIIDTSGVQVTGVVWTEGTNTAHSAGATVVDYVAASHQSMMTKGLLVEHKQTGTHAAVTADSLVTTGAVTAGGTLTASGAMAGALATMWNPLSQAPNSVTANGGHSYSLVFNSIDYTSTLSAGMRIRTTRTSAAPTQSTLLNGSTQYYSKSSPSGMTFTDDFAVSGWFKVTALTGSNQGLASRYNGTSGWVFFINLDGTLSLQGNNAGGSNLSYIRATQTTPVGRWVHLAGQLDMSSFTNTSTTSYLMIDGVNVNANVSRGGTNPTALVQAGNLEIGSYNGGTNPLGGAVAQVAIYSAKVTQAAIIATMSQGVTGAESSEISAYSFNNSINDLNANANNLTANGSAVATNADSPFGTQASGSISSTLDYGVIASVTFSTNTTVNVTVPAGNTIPSTGGVSAVAWSTADFPYGSVTPLAGGLVIQTGQVVASITTADTRATTSINFPIPFRQLLATWANNNTDVSAASNEIWVNNYTSTNSTAGFRFITPSAFTGTATATWVAIGYI